MRVKILAQIVFNFTRHSNQDAALEKEERPADHASAEYHERGDCQARPGNLAPVCVDGVANDQRNVKVEKDTSQYAGDANSQRDLIRKKVAAEFSQIVHAQKAP